VNKFFKINFLLSRAVLFGFSYLKKMEAEAVLFLVALPQDSAAASLIRFRHSKWSNSDFYFSCDAD